MIKKIYFDWYKENEYNQSFGQITYVDKYDEKIAVHNFDNINKKQFKSIFKAYKMNNEKDIYVEYKEML